MAKYKKLITYVLAIALVALIITILRLHYSDKTLSIKKPKAKLPPEMEYIFLGNEFYHKDQFKEAIYYYEIAIEKLKENYLNNTKQIAIYYDKLGRLYCLLREMEKASEYFRKSKSIRENYQWHLPEGIANSYENLAYVNYANRNFNKTLKYLEKAKSLRLQPAERNYFDIANTYFFISKVYDAKGNTTSALKYYEKVLQIRKDMLSEETPMTAFVYYMIGLKNYQLRKYNKAIENYIQSIEIYNKLPGFYNQQIINLYNNLGYAFYKKGDYKQAIASLENINYLENNFSTSELFDLIMSKRPIHYIKEESVFGYLLFFTAGLFLGTFLTYNYLNNKDKQSYTEEMTEEDKPRPSKTKKSEVKIEPKAEYPDPEHKKEKLKKFKPIKVKASRIGDPFTPDEVVLGLKGVTFKIKEDLGSTEDFIIYGDISGVKVINGVKWFKLILAHVVIEPKNRPSFMIKYLSKRDAKIVKEYIQKKAE